MRIRDSFGAAAGCALAALLVIAGQARGQGAAPSRTGLWGDYQVTVDFEGRQMPAILAFTRDADGNRTGHWISYFGMDELQDVNLAGNQLSFTWVRQGRDGQAMTSKFAGTLEEGRIEGTLSSDRGEFKVQGERMRRIPRAVGTWDLKVKMGEREFAATLVVKADAAGALAAEWQSQWGETAISDVAFEESRLTFKRKTKVQDQEWESTFEATLEGDGLTGVIKSERGEAQVAGTRVGSALIGTWNLEIASDRGLRKQRFRVNPDMTGLFGSIPVEKIGLEGTQVRFKIVQTFGEQTFEMGFEGSLVDSKLSGELTTPRGTQKVTGEKVARPARSRGPA